MKKVVSLLLLVGVVTAIILPFPSAQTRLKSYFGGDALMYAGKTVIATTNTGELELFTVSSDGTIDRFVAMRSYDARFAKPVDFKDVVLNVEEGKLYAYAVDGKSIIKYDISDLHSMRQVASAQDNSWDYFGGVDKIHNYIATIGSNGIKLWTANMQVFDQYKIVTPGNYVFNSSDAGSSRYVFTVGEEKIRMFDRESRSTFREIPLNFTWAGGFYNRAIYNDTADNMVYVVDDEAVHKINFNGEIVDSFDHTGSQGYDVVPSIDGKHIYFSDGIGIVKLRKSDMTVVDFKYTQTLSGDHSWAMGLKVVQDGSSEKLVLFNSSGIVMLDSNLEPIRNQAKKVITITTNAIETFPPVSEPVYLKIDRNRAATGSTVLVSGGGFGQFEPVMIEFGETSVIELADEKGMFNTSLIVPAVKSPRGVDIKARGQVTNITYSLGFNIE